MSELGEQLKQARIARGLTLDDVQELTKIRKRYLEAIEAGDYKVLPGSFYVRAFIKTYAETVGIDPDELFAEHRQDVPEAIQEKTMEPVIQKRRSRQSSERNSKWLSTTLMWSFAALILIVIYLYFVVWGKTDEKDANQTDPTPVTTQAGDTGKKENGNATPGNNSSTDATNNGQTDQTDQTDGSQNSGNNSENNNTPDTEAQNVVVSPDGKEGSTTKFKVQSAGSQPVQVVITATGASWVEVYKGNKNGEKLYYATTQSGEVLTYELGAEGLFIKSGASPNTTITVAGQEVTDGKNTSKIQLNLDNGAGGTGNTEANNSGVTGTEGISNEGSVE